MNLNYMPKSMWTPDHHTTLHLFFFEHPIPDVVPFCFHNNLHSQTELCGFARSATRALVESGTDVRRAEPAHSLHYRQFKVSLNFTDSKVSDSCVIMSHIMLNATTNPDLLYNCTESPCVGVMVRHLHTSGYIVYELHYTFLQKAWCDAYVNVTPNGSLLVTCQITT